MPPSHECSPKYFPLRSDDGSETESEKRGEDIDDIQGEDPRVWSIIIFIFCVFVLCYPLTVATYWLIERSFNTDGSTAVYSSPACPDPPIRREWRSLSGDEKQDYLLAVQCLRETPSRLGLNQSLYDDFPYVHIRVGGYCMTSFFAHNLDIC